MEFSDQVLRIRKETRRFPSIMLSGVSFPSHQILYPSSWSLLGRQDLFFLLLGFSFDQNGGGWRWWLLTRKGGRSSPGQILFIEDRVNSLPTWGEFELIRGLTNLPFYLERSVTFVVQLLGRAVCLNVRTFEVHLVAGRQVQRGSGMLVMSPLRRACRLDDCLACLISHFFYPLRELIRRFDQRRLPHRLSLPGMLSMVEK